MNSSQVAVAAANYCYHLLDGCELLLSRHPWAASVSCALRAALVPLILVAASVLYTLLCCLEAISALLCL